MTDHSPTTPGKTALVVRGGWDGHQPVEATELFLPFLRDNGYDVRVEESTAVYADEAYMRTVDLIVQSNTMTSIQWEEFLGLRAAVERGTGLAGWHGGIADSYRDNSDYLRLIGGQFASHPGKHPDERTGEQSDNYMPHTIEMTALAADHPITQGVSDFELVTEQYWVFARRLQRRARHDHAGRPPVGPVEAPDHLPAIWTRLWGEGRIFVSTPGHRVEILQDDNVRTIIERGMLWASR